MISGRAMAGARDYHKRHLKANDYYEKNKSVIGHWIGNGCETFGVSPGAPVSDSEFESLRNNLHATNNLQITRRNNTSRKESDGKIVENRRAFYDFVFSAPKSFSVLSITLGDKKVKEFHNKAIDKVLREIEKWTGRQDHKNPSSRVERTGKFVAARYQHDANRSLEPNLHDHIIIFNMTPSTDGHAYAIESREYFDRIQYFTAIYRDELAKQAIDAGCYIEFDKYGAPQIRAKNRSMKDICDRFSSRSEIKTLLCEKLESIIGSQLSNNEVTLIVRNSRGLKRNLFDNLVQHTVFSGSRSEIITAFCNLIARCSDGGLVETTTEEVLRAQKDCLSLEEQALLQEIQETMDGTVKERRTPLPSLVESFKGSVKHCFERKSVVPDHELFESIIRTCCGKGVSIESLKEIEAHFLKSDANGLVKVGNDLTTVKHLRQEQSMIKWITKGQGYIQEENTSFVPSEKLNTEQCEAVLKCIHSKDQFKVLIGKAGTGKTFTLSEIVRAYIEKQKSVHLFAPSNGARDVLRNDGAQIEKAFGLLQVGKAFQSAQSLQLLLQSTSMQNAIGKGAFVVLDEAGLASVQQMHDFMKLAFYKGWNVQLCGDPRQHTSVEAGDSLRILLRTTPIERARLSHIQRQKPIDYRSAAKAFAGGQTILGFYQLERMGALQEAKGEDFSKALAEHYLKLYQPNNPKSVIVVVPSHREIDAVSLEIRKGLQKEGKLEGETSIATLRSLGWTVAEREHFANYQAGMQIQRTRGKFKGETLEVMSCHPDKLICKNGLGDTCTLRVQNMKYTIACESHILKLAPGDIIMNRFGTRESINGELLTFKSVNASGNIETMEGKTLTHRNIIYGYASTSHKAQGATYDNVVLGFDRESISSVDQKLAYVGSTRGKIGIHVVVENKSDLQGIQKRTGDRKSALELVDAKRIARSQSKALANQTVAMKLMTGPTESEKAQNVSAIGLNDGVKPEHNHS